MIYLGSNLTTVYETFSSVTLIQGCTISLYLRLYSRREDEVE